MADIESREGAAAAPEGEAGGEEESSSLVVSTADGNVAQAAEDTASAAGILDDANVDDQVIVNESERIGTTASARFNILSTMVGGGSLSLPLAFKKSGNALIGPIMLLGTAIVTEFCFRLLVRSARTLHPVSGDGTTHAPVGYDSFESLAAAAFGPRALVLSKILVVLMCFFGTVGYAVLLRDMLEPITRALYHLSDDPTRWQGNSVMLTVVVLVTPLCTLKTLTALKRFGAASMFSVLILGSCVLFRSVQCNLSSGGSSSSDDWTIAFRLFPERWMDLLDVVPLYISCYVCHYNILTVHNELRKPSEARVSWWLRSTTWSASMFYLVLGFSGSAYSKCTPDHSVSGNILLDFDDSDPLLLVGRMCLAITITLAFPMLTIPARDIVIRSMKEYKSSAAAARATETSLPMEGLSENQQQEALEEPLLTNDHVNNDSQGQGQAAPNETNVILKTSLGLRLGIAIILFWTATAVACCVASIDIVWDLLGSSLSIILSYLIPCGSYIVIMRQFPEASPPSGGRKFSIAMAWVIVAITGPLMFISTANAVRSTFF